MIFGPWLHQQTSNASATVSTLMSIPSPSISSTFADKISSWTQDARMYNKDQNIDRRKSHRVVPMEVICPGYSRTGTLTMQKALEILGYPNVYVSTKQYTSQETYIDHALLPTHSTLAPSTITSGMPTSGSTSSPPNSKAAAPSPNPPSTPSSATAAQ